MSRDTWNVLFTATAAEQARVVDDWWMREHPAAPRLFSDELVQAIERLSSMPASGAPFPAEAATVVRRILLPRSRYHLYYTTDPARREVMVRAVWHAARGQGPKLG